MGAWIKGDTTTSPARTRRSRSGDSSVHRKFALARSAICAFAVTRYWSHASRAARFNSDANAFAGNTIVAAKVRVNSTARKDPEVKRGSNVGPTAAPGAA